MRAPDGVAICRKCGGAIHYGEEAYEVDLCAVRAATGRRPQVNEADGVLMHPRCYDEFLVTEDVCDGVGRIVVAGEEVRP